ncbi:phage tail protein [Pseudomonas endophytica]|uniref:Phage tail protein n=1 Tax=Pseudomonas endophytica TaxID=1563157 RepID=A0A0Q0YWL1_9PSED|nr:phage tail protein [Pseudomonas endophytica]KQB53786.1 phage tail protein [Pseudomonas endophytica]
MGYKLPNGATFQHAATYAAPLAFSGISNATEAVATVAAATLVVGDIVLVSSNWTPLNGRVARVKAATATAITLEGIDTSDTQVYPPLNGAGSLKKVLAWALVPQVSDVAFSGGEQNYLTVAFLEDAQGRELPTDKSPARMTLTVADDPAQSYVPIVQAADAGGAVHASRLNLPGKDTIYYGAITAWSPQPVVSRSNLMTRTITLALQAPITRYLS